MKANRLCLVVLISLRFGWPEVCSAQPPYSITVHADMHSVRAGAAVDVSVTFKNTSNGIVKYEDSNAALQDFRILVWRKDGAQVPYTSFGREFYGTPPDIMLGRIEEHSLSPGETDTETGSLTTVYNMSAPGDYFVQAQLGTPYSVDPSGIKSNIIAVSVTP